MRSHHRRPFLLRVPWVIRRSITTKRIACSARLLVGSIPGVVTKRKYACAMLAKAFGQVAGMFRVRHTDRARPKHLVPCRFQRLLKTRRSHRLAAVDDGKQFPQRFLEPLTVGSVLLARQRQQKPHVADQVARQNCTRTSNIRMYLR